MKVLRFIKRFFIAVIGIAYAGFLVLCSLSGPLAEDGVTGTSFIGTPKVAFAAGEYKVDVLELNIPLQSGETALLKDFTLLQSADFSGSENVEEIAAWGKAHPEVALRYTVELPTGETVAHDVTSLDFSGIDNNTLLAACELLPLLPDVNSIELGTAPDEASILSPDALSTLAQTCPEASLHYAFQLYGQTMDFESESIDLTGISREELPTVAGVLARIPNMKQITLGSTVDGSCVLGWEDLDLLMESCPNAALDYRFSLYGETLDLNCQALDYSYKNISDGGEAILQAIPYLKNCATLDMDSCGLSNEQMAKIREAAPQTKVIWRVWFGENYSVRTDATKILASKPSVGGMLYDDCAEQLQYCTDIKYLDIGHNTDLGTLSFVSGMKDLEVLIIAMTDIKDISPLANCPKIEYVELNSTAVTSLDALKDAKALRHLNIAQCPKISDLTPLYGLTEMERLWIGNETPIPDEQVAEMRKLAPNCTVNDTTTDPHGEKWRFSKYDPAIPLYYWVPRHELLREQMGYNYQEYSFYWLDPKCDKEAPPEHAGKYGKEVYG